MGANVRGPIFCHPVPRVTMEVGTEFMCPNCNIAHLGTDHFKCGCPHWEARVHLGKGFVHCKGARLHHGKQHLSNKANNAMITHRATLKCMNTQHLDWLPHEPLCDADPLTGHWCSTGVVPINVWENLPVDFCFKPMHQNNSLESCVGMGNNVGHGNLVTLNAPHHALECFEDSFHAHWCNVQCELKDHTLPLHKAWVFEHEQQKAHIECLESQIVAGKCVVNASMVVGQIAPAAFNLCNLCIDPIGHPHCIAPAAAMKLPAAPVPSGPNNIAKTNLDLQLDKLEDMDDGDPEMWSLFWPNSGVKEIKLLIRHFIYHSFCLSHQCFICMRGNGL